MKKSQLSLVLLLAATIFAFSSCRSIREMKNLTKCQFRINTVKNIELAGVNIQHVRSYKDLSVKDAARATTALVSGNLPLSMLINLEVKNPNKQTAALNRVDWIAMIYDYQLVNGIVANRVEVEPGGGVANIPIMVGVNLNEILKSVAKNDRLDFGMGLTDQSDRPTRVALKLKPSIMVGSKAIAYPGWFTVKRDFVSQ